MTSSAGDGERFTSSHLRPLDPRVRARLIDAYSPGARVVRARRLRGGIGARTQALDIIDVAETRSKVVLRVYLERNSLTPERARREFRAIELAQSARVPSPRPLFLDADGQFFGTPTMLLSYLPGRPKHQPHDRGAWADELVRAMRSVHAVSPASHDLDWLPRFGRAEIAAELEELRLKVMAHKDGIAREVMLTLEGSFDRVAWPTECLIHEDFWPGNTVWLRGKLIGIIDWVNAKVGDPRIDLSQCRIDALLANSLEVSDALEDAYRRVSPAVVRDLWFTDLFQGLRCLLYYEIWLIAYHDAGLTFITKEHARERVHAFLRRALDTTRASSL
jgi:aminoglycoside phosphotransferase (APT) family kinase protein